jgi:hypothetical protein
MGLKLKPFKIKIWLVKGKWSKKRSLNTDVDEKSDYFLHQDYNVLKSDSNKIYIFGILKT